MGILVVIHLLQGGSVPVTFHCLQFHLINLLKQKVKSYVCSQNSKQRISVLRIFGFPTGDIPKFLWFITLLHIANAILLVYRAFKPKNHIKLVVDHMNISWYSNIVCSYFRSLYPVEHPSKISLTCHIPTLPIAIPNCSYHCKSQFLSSKPVISHYPLVI